MATKRVIAVVEDDDSVREALLELLEALDLQSVGFDTAEACLEAYSPEAFSIVITDVQLPGINGLELQRELRARGAALPVILVSSRDDAATRLRAMGDGATAYLTKPLAGMSLVRVLLRTLAGERARVEDSWPWAKNSGSRMTLEPKVHG